MDDSSMPVVAIMFFLITGLQGFVQLHSSIGSLSGNLGPRNITFTCDANFTSGTIHWFIDNTSISSYAFSTGDVYPLVISTNPPIPGITVQLGDVMSTLGVFSFKNFTLMTVVCNLLQFEGKSLSCGLMEQRSEFISINLVIHNSNLTVNITITAIYSEKGRQLSRITVKWKDKIMNSICSTSNSYFVEFRNLRELLSHKLITSENCSNMTCSVEFNPPQNATVIHYISVESVNYFGKFKDNFTSTFILDSFPDILKYNLHVESCKAHISCSLVKHHKTCDVSYGFDSTYKEFRRNIIVPMNTSTMLIPQLIIPRTYYIEITALLGGSEIIVRDNFTTDLPEIINATFTATYWNNGSLIEIEVKWSIVEVFGCSVINSTISLQNNEGFTVTEEVVNPWTCINKACRLNFNPNDYRIDYILYAQNNYSEGSLNTSSIIISGSSYRSYVKYLVSYGTCITTIQCFTLNDNCLVWLSENPDYQNLDDPAILSSNMQYTMKYRLKFSMRYYIRVSTQLNSTIIFLIGNFTTSNDPKTLDNSDIIFMIATRTSFFIIIVILTYGYSATKCFLKQKSREGNTSKKPDKIFILLASLMFFVCFVTWIMVGIIIGLNSGMCDETLLLLKIIFLKIAYTVTDISVIVILCALIIVTYLEKKDFLSKSNSNQKPAVSSESSYVKDEVINMKVNEVYALHSSKIQKRFQETPHQSTTTTYEYIA